MGSVTYMSVSSTWMVRDATADTTIAHLSETYATAKQMKALNDTIDGKRV